MKRIVVAACAVLCLAVWAGNCQASWGHLTYSGYQPWWNIFAKRYKCLTPEEERLQKFWHDYYHAMKSFYKSLDSIDWVAYYKNHGYQINACGPYGAGCGRINYAPVFVSPTLQWAVPAGAAGGPPVGPPYANGHTQPMMPFPMSPYGPHGPGPHGPGPHAHAAGGYPPMMAGPGPGPGPGASAGAGPMPMPMMGPMPTPVSTPAGNGTTPGAPRIGTGISTVPTN
jgi:hypothetical protein